MSKDVFKASDSEEKVIDRLSELARDGEYVFRGYGKQKELYPTIIRGTQTFDDVESELLEKFEHYGSHYFHATTPIDFMSYAQHFGLPTRLLDFTYNPFIALSFSLYMTKSNGAYSDPEDKEYYYIRYASTKTNIVLSTIPLSDDIYNLNITRSNSLATQACQTIDKATVLFSDPRLMRQNDATSLSRLAAVSNEPQDSTGLESLQKKISDKAILFIDPNQSNQRIIMQQGLFMFPYTLDKQRHRQIIEVNSSVIKIHERLRKKLLVYLDTLGFNAFRLMPDLASICEAVKRNVLDNRKERSGSFKKSLDDY